MLKVMPPSPASPETPGQENKYRSQLEQQIGSGYASIPPRFRVGDPQNPIPPEYQESDRLCGLPVMNDKVRDWLITRTASCVTNNQAVVVLEIDSDQLKAANTKVARQFGDEVIRYGAATGARLLDQAQLSCQIAAVRPGSSPDETLFFLFNPSPEDLNKIPAVRSAANAAKKVTVPDFKGKSVDFTIGNSCGIASTRDIRHSAVTTETKQLLETGQIRQASALLHSLQEHAESTTKGIKALHELGDIPIEDLLKLSIRNLMDTVAEKFGNTRVSPAGLRIIMMITSIITSRSLSEKSSQSDTSLQPTMAQLESELKDKRATNSLRKIVTAFNSLFPPQLEPQVNSIQ
ncbi:hypothetical protein A2876_04955 [Candidatus Amesbacteria bacterium RIFCSPHIGHO2_01_FULL_48_32b]|uniref:Uncharacterized protein n=1 Tax=Candidatus Amesbacteria bacterium RIFCSPHIGHO2_01_FULL_48_32b TaxID=1797253 RepID=A0A1F4YJ01_9BACT|nr:MAG: hypothetical protein A2876_04955 [Candidatus Amesbacteria bacterium RIFCSPHIGHO2_01_FULL_48_32b]